MTDRIVKTPTGTYIGKDNDGIAEFLGIRYAAPVQRWKAPHDVTTTTEDVMEAKEWGPSCTQRYDPVEIASHWKQSEDPLTLNIWTKDTNTSGKPVMVFIHGGGGLNGGSYDPLYYGGNFVRRLPEGEDVVYVTINYRIGFFGALNLEGLDGYTEDYADSYNLWFLDHIQALKWVHENIDAFGGDPDNVTILGQSAGAGFVSTLMCIEKARPYFHKVVAQSGPLFNRQITRAKAREIASGVFKQLGVTSMDEILAISAEDIKASLLEGDFIYGAALYFPVADDRLIPLDCHQALRDGCAKDIMLMIGNTNGERDSIATDLEWATHVLKRTDENVEGLATGLATAGHEDVVQEYLAMYDDQLLGTTELCNDLNYTFGNILIADAQSRWNPNTYVYNWQWAPNAEELKKRLPETAEVSPYGRALHCSDLIYTFNNDDSYPELSGPVDLHYAPLKTQASYTWYCFAKSGDPNNAMIPHWDAYNTDTRSIMFIDQEWSLHQDPFKQRRQLLMQLVR